MIPVKTYYFEQWCFCPTQATLSSPEGDLQEITPRMRDVLILLLHRAGSVVGRDEIFEQVWHDKNANDEALSRVIADLRKALGDSAFRSRFIKTIPKAGYKFIAGVDINVSPPQRTAETPQHGLSDNLRLKWWGSVIMLLIMVTSAWYISSAINRTTPVQLGSSRPLFTSQWNAGLASWSPDGERLVFSRTDASGLDNLYIMSTVVGAAEIQLTESPAFDWFASWSPDGNDVAFQRFDGAGGCLLMRVNLSTRQETQLTHCLFGSGVAWLSADEIAYISMNEGQSDRAVWIFKLSSGKSELEPNSQKHSPGPFHALGSDSSRRLTAIFKSTGESTQILRADSHWNYQSVLTSATPIMGFTWLPDQQQLLFSQHLNGVPTLFYYRLGSDTPIRLDPLVGSGIAYPSLSADGKKLVFSRYESDTELWHFDTGSAKRLDRFSGSFHGVSCEPDSEQMAVIVRPPNSKRRLQVSNIHQRQWRRISEFDTTVVRPIFSPDGERILLTRVDIETNTSQVDLVDLETGLLNHVTSGSRDHVPTSWNHNGELFYALERIDGKPSLGEYNVDGQRLGVASIQAPRLRELSKDSQVIARPNSDGERVLVWRKGTQETTLIKLNSALSPAAWDASASAVYYFAYVGDGVELKRLPLTGGAAETLVHVDPPFNHLSLRVCALDDQSVMYSIGRDKIELYVADVHH